MILTRCLALCCVRLRVCVVLQAFIASCGTYSNLVRQAKSKQKIIDKMEEAGLTEKVVEDARYNFEFPK